MKLKRYKHKQSWSKRILPVFIIGSLALVICWFIQLGIVNAKVVMAEAQMNQGQGKIISGLSTQNEELKTKLERDIVPLAPKSIQELSKFYIKKYFGNNADRVIVVMSCESGLSNVSVHVNKPGLGTDYGLYQLNDRWHKARFEKMYGVKFEIGALDFDLASKYAKYLYDHNGLTSWVCNRII